MPIPVSFKAFFGAGIGHVTPARSINGIGPPRQRGMTAQQSGTHAVRLARLLLQDLPLQLGDCLQVFLLLSQLTLVGRDVDHVVLRRRGENVGTCQRSAPSKNR